MRTLREHLRIAFSLIQPEALIASLRNEVHKHKGALDSTNIDLLSYRRFSRELFKTLTYEEIDMLYDNMSEIMEFRGKTCGEKSVFALLPEYTIHVLKTDGSEPICRQEHILNWRHCYLFLGQDLLTAAHFAYINVCENREPSDFLWPAQIKSDDRRLCEILKKGLVENHFHLNGSSRIFDLSWICLMNHPDHISHYFTNHKRNVSETNINNFFEENLNTGISLGANDNRFSWSKRLSIACWLRTKLFFWIQYEDITAAFQNERAALDELFKFIDHDFSDHSLRDIVESARYLFGESRKMPQPNGKSKCLDYAITKGILNPDDINNCCRSLAGERAFLYKSLYCIYSRAFANEYQRKCFMDMFFLYLLIKIQFRNELIQVNQRYGFKNFAKYQDRKDLIFETFSEYELEAKNLSVHESMENGYVRSLEMRITPKNNAEAQQKKILDTDKALEFLKTHHKPEKLNLHQELNTDYFYVLHFPKIPEHPKNQHREKWLAPPRNSILRENTKKQALAIACAMENNNLLCTRIRGFDACTFEIGCRPEIFSTEFRFLRKLVLTKQRDSVIFGKALQPKLSATFHVGEDFMDLIDGLRAIDEAVTFLEFEPGERLGHAMALGINPCDYYNLKHNRIILTKQDYLDNAVWMLNKTQRFGIKIDSILKWKLEDTANRLKFELYGSNYSISDYYNSWMLRGDDPELYRFNKFDESLYYSMISYKVNSILCQYYTQRIMKPYHIESLNSIRKNAKAAELYSMYHFDYDVKERGQKTEEVKIGETYIETVNLLQNKMMQEISNLRLCIETNPSSNVLIGPFDRYEQHPLFRFYPVNSSTEDTVQFVSVNTDDQGVFDTSLAMEYSLLACALRKAKDENHNLLYNDETIYRYLEMLRENGFSQIFPKTK